MNENKFRVSNTYTHIEIWIGSQKVYCDTSNTEYLFNDKSWPQARKIKNGEYEILIKMFDAPDFNKIYALYFKNYYLTKAEILPFFNNAPADIDNDGIKEYSGVLHVSDAYGNNDSCYYNPTLYYKSTDVGLKLDSALTIKMNKKIWREFYGFVQSNKLLPCASK